MKLTLLIAVSMEHGETRAVLTKNGAEKPMRILSKAAENKLFALTDFLESERPTRKHIPFKTRVRDALDIIDRDGAVDIATYADECLDGDKHNASYILRRCMKAGYLKPLVASTGHVVRGSYVRNEPRRVALAEGA